MKNMVDVTIVTVVYNAETTIESTILSVINQSFKNFEYIVIDGNSSDGTMEIVKKYQQFIKELVSEPDKGIYDAMNKGISLASGKWICFMNSGDCFHDNLVLEKLFLNTNYSDNVGVIFGDANLTNGSQYIGSFKNTPFWETHFPYKTGKGICHQSMFTLTSLAKKNPFDLRYRISADFDMAYKIFKQHYRFMHVPVIVSDFDVNGFSSAGIDWRITYRETGEILNCQNDILYRIYYFYKKLKICVKALLNIK